ncbi:MAG: hypothetical protein HKN29_10645 [Rhodothermales bacterium]|nr:hypothetical protein [Rhodothermales bacterium]
MTHRSKANGILIVLLAYCTFAQPEKARAQSAGSVAVSGAVQLRATAGISDSSGQERVGFGVRRARLRFDGQLAQGPGAFVQIDGAGGTANVLDFFVYYDLSSTLRIRAGRMVSAQPRSFIRTGMFQIDGVDRPAVAERWGQGTVGGDGRDFGIDAHLKSGALEALVFLHNGDGSWDRRRGNFRESISGGSATGGLGQTRLAVTGAFRVTPSAPSGLELGVFGGYNPVEGPNTVQSNQGRTYVTYGAHAYLGANPASRRLRLKADLIGTTYEALPGRDSQQSLGIILFGAFGVTDFAEVYVRSEALEEDLNGSDDADGYFSAGFSFSPSARRGGAYHAERITLDYGRFKGGELMAEAENLITLQLQLVF